jgi:hypothetical protein
LAALSAIIVSAASSANARQRHVAEVGVSFPLVRDVTWYDVPEERVCCYQGQEMAEGVASGRIVETRRPAHSGSAPR